MCHLELTLFFINEFLLWMFLAGAVAFLIPQYDGFLFDFTLVEIYGGSHLTLAGSNVTVRSIKVIGDDTGHFHVGPSHTFELVEVGR